MTEKIYNVELWIPDSSEEIHCISHIKPSEMHLKKLCMSYLENYVEDFEQYYGAPLLENIDLVPLEYDKSINGIKIDCIEARYWRDRFLVFYIYEKETVDWNDVGKITIEKNKVKYVSSLDNI